MNKIYNLRMPTLISINVMSSRREKTISHTRTPQIRSHTNPNCKKTQ